MLSSYGRVASRALRAPVALVARRAFASRYEGDVGDVLRFDCAFPPSTKLTPRELRGRVVLVVNTASQCALAAAQLPALQQLHERYHERGLRIVAVPSNDFEKKEPGTEEEIVAAYTTPSGAFQTQFYIAKKSAVSGDKAHEFFDRVAKKYGRSVAPTWNFDKFLVDPYGDLCAVFPHDTEPLEPQVIEAIEDALAEIMSEADLEEDSDDEEEEDEYDSDEESDDNEEDTKKRGTK